MVPGPCPRFVSGQSPQAPGGRLPREETFPGLQEKLPQSSRRPTPSKFSSLSRGKQGPLPPAGRVQVRAWQPAQHRQVPQWGRKTPNPNSSPTSHHRGGDPAAWTVADRRVHLQNPLGHKRLQTFPCRRAEAGLVRERAHTWGPRTRARFRGAVSGKASRQAYEHPRPSNFRARHPPLRPTPPSRTPRGSAKLRTWRSGRAPSPDERGPPPPCAPPPAPHPLRADPPEPGARSRVEEGLPQAQVSGAVRSWGCA